MKTLTITRIRGYSAMARAVALYVDGKKVGQLKQRETLTLEVPDTAQVMQGKIDWAKTEPFPLTDVPNGANLVIRAWFTLNPLRNLGISSMPMLIELEAPEVEAFS